ISTSPIGIWMCWLLAFLGTTSYQSWRSTAQTGSIAGHKVLRIYDMNTAEWPMNMPRYVLPDWAGKIWIAYAGGGIIAFDRTTERITDVLGGAGLPQFAASSRLYVGRDGAAWLLSHTGIRTIRSDRGQWIEAPVPGAELIGPAFSVFQDR